MELDPQLKGELIEDTRKAEAEIDDCIQKMDVWKVKREVLLRRLMTVWRDGLELVGLSKARAARKNVLIGTPFYVALVD